ncbi:MAG: PAS domain-containing protein [Candidatus Methanoperedens sp.]|nr:PAS domain-containing protein [Candidatus Methanoperedens sp.]
MVTEGGKGGLKRWDEVQRGEGKPYEVDIVQKDGTVRSLSVSHNEMELGGKRKYCAIAKDITERKHVEDALRENESKLSQAQRIAHIGSWVYNVTGKLSWSDETYRIFGVSPDTFTLNVESFLNLIHPDDRAAMQAWINACLAGEKPGELEFRSIMPDGSIHFISGLGELKYDAENRPISMTGTAQDITERKQAEEEIRLGRERLALAQEVGKIGTFEWNIQENRTIWTEQMEALYGLQPGGFGGKNEQWEKMLHPEDHDRVMAEAARAISEKKDLEIEYRVVLDDGSVHWILDTARTIYDDSDKPLRMVGVNMDITERKQAAEKLRKSEELFRKLIEAEPECVKLLTKENILVDMNPAGIRMIEADSREQVIGKSVLGIIDPEYRKDFVELIQRVFNGESAFLEFSITGLKGSKRWLETHAVPLRDDNGKINLLISVTRDTTERKREEQERFALVAREQAALAGAEAARKLDRMKSMFIASTSHELKTPLNSIIGFTSLILDGTSGELNPDQKEQLAIVLSSGKHLLALINDILDLSMIESGRIKVVVSEFNLRQIVDEAASSFNVILHEKKLELKAGVGDIRMKSDRMRILQCIVNLLSNAIKYTEKGSVEITAKVIENNVEISVIDTGIGIKTEDIPKLFSPFVRLHSPLTLKTSGTGLGLYLVQKIVRDFLDGDVEVKSEFGIGSKFTLLIPIELEGKV